MGGGPDKHVPILIEDDEVHPLGSRVNALVIKDEPDEQKVINLDSEDEKEGVLDGEDIDSEIDEPAHKQELQRELKALGIDLSKRPDYPKPLDRPDYTKPLDEPSWGDSDEEEDSDVDMDMDADGVLDGEDESDEYEDDDMAEDELVERVKAGKRGIMA